MAETVGSHGVAAFTNPSNGDALDATVVKGNDNTLRSAYVDHDNDGGVHIQSSSLASRPSAGTQGRKWMTTDSGSVRLWYDNGTSWEEVNYVQNVGSVSLQTVTITGALTVDTTTLVVDNSNNRVGVGTATPLAPLDVVGNAAFSANVTVGGGVTVTGTVIANTFSGSGASLTSLPAAQITGTLPAISGANLTSLNASNISSGTISASRLPSTINATRIANIDITGSTISDLSGGNRVIVQAPYFTAGTHSTGATPIMYFRVDDDYFIDTNTYVGGNVMADFNLENNGSNTTINDIRGPSGTTTRGFSDDQFLRIRNKNVVYYIRLERWT